MRRLRLALVVAAALALSGYHLIISTLAGVDTRSLPSLFRQSNSSTAGAYLAKSNASEKRLPSCIVIGVRKGGTRALLDMIGLHSRVRQAGAEVHFFDVESNYARGLEWYREQMPALRRGGGQLAVEKTPSYFNTESVPGRVRRMDAGILLLLVVRDPVTRLISDYTQILHNHREKGLGLRSFEEFAFVPGGGGGNLTVNVRYDAIHKSLYSVHMRRWLAHFPLAQIHVVNGDRFIRKPWQELNKVEDFLGLEREISKDLFYFNATKGFHCVRRRRREEDGSGGGPSASVGDHCLTKSKGRQHPQVSKAAVSKLRRFYSRYNYEFYDLVGHDFGWPEE